MRIDWSKEGWRVWPENTFEPHDSFLLAPNLQVVGPITFVHTNGRGWIDVHGSMEIVGEIITIYAD